MPLTTWLTCMEQQRNNLAFSGAPASVWAVVLMWNQAPETLRCIQSLRQSDWPALSILVVDNGSRADEAALVSSACPDLPMLRLPVNHSVSRGYNAGANFAFDHGADCVLLINNDTLAEPDMVSRLMSAAGGLGTGVVAAPAIYYAHDPQAVWSLGGRWRRLSQTIVMVKRMPDLAPDCLAQEWLTGCCLLIPRAIWRATTGFDENLLFYFEDWDFSLRARQSGARLVCVTGARLRHVTGASSLKRMGRLAGDWKYWRLMGLNGCRFYRKHFGAGSILISTAWVVARETLKLRFGRSMGYLSGVLAALGRQAPRLDSSAPPM